MLDTIDKSMRKELLDQRRTMPAAEHEEATQTIRGRLSSLLPALRINAALAYTAFRGEPDVLPVLLAPELKIFLPRITGPGTMEFCHVTEPQDLTTNALGILEPKVNCPVEEAPRKGLQYAIIIPCVAASRQGIRLGYGGGYYDRFLPSWPKAAKIGITFDQFFCREIPSEGHDIALDYVITQTEIWDVDRASAFVAHINP